MSFQDVSSNVIIYQGRVASQDADGRPRQDARCSLLGERCGDEREQCEVFAIKENRLVLALPGSAQEPEACVPLCHGAHAAHKVWPTRARCHSIGEGASDAIAGTRTLPRGIIAAAEGSGSFKPVNSPWPPMPPMRN